MQFYLLAFLSFMIATSSLLAMPKQVILLRHAEKPATGDTLSPLGFKRATALVTYFSQNNLPFQLQTAVAVYAQSSDKDHGSTRCVQTIGPLANFLEVPLYTKYSRDEYKKMVEEIDKTYSTGLVLICWSHDNLNKIAAQFGIKKTPKWTGSAYDPVWVIHFDDSKAASFQMFTQNPTLNFFE